MRRFLGVFLVLWLLAGSRARRVADDPIAQAVAWLHTQQCDDGSFGFRGSNGVCTPSASADRRRGLRVGTGRRRSGWCGMDRGGSECVGCPRKAGPWLRVCECRTGRQSRVRAVALSGGNPRSFGGLNLVGIIQAAYDSTTGRYQPDWLSYHALAIEGLLRASEPVPNAAISALMNAQLPEGSWAWSFNDTQGDVDTTGLVMQLLGGQAHVGCFSGYARAADYLTSAQTAIGGWGVYPPPNTNPPNANSTGLAVAGLNATGFDPRATRFQKNGHGALDTLLTFQEASGAFVYVQQAGKEESRLMATVDVLRCVPHNPESHSQSAILSTCRL